MSYEASVVVSTPQAILLVNLTSKMTTVLDMGRTEYYGISWFPNGSDFVLSHSGLDNGSLHELGDYAGSEVGYLSLGDQATEKFLSQPHQVLCLPDGRVLCTNTGRNAVTAIDMASSGTRHEVRLSDARWDRADPSGKSGDHLNSLHLSGNSVLVLAHGFDRGSRIGRLTYPDLALAEVQEVRGRSGLHNLWETSDGQLISCLSSAGALLDIRENQILWQAVAHNPVYTRGLAASDDFVVVGESSYADRSGRQASQSGLWVIDRSSWRAIDYVALGPIGPVHDVRLIDVPDHAHHGAVFGAASLLPGRNALSKTADERLRLDSEASTTLAEWKEMESIFGTATPRSGGALEASAAGVVLMGSLHPRINAMDSLHVHYSLRDAHDGGHVGVVLYAGAGADTDMDAFILRMGGDGKASLVLWTHDGRAWAADPRFSMSGLPVEGDVGLDRDASNVTISVDSEAAFSIPLTELAHAGGRLGIRWFGSEIARSYR